ncbi:hypothetical protein MASR1M74_13610 [Lentimicrobium sp.]
MLKCFARLFVAIGTMFTANLFAQHPNIMLGNMRNPNEPSIAMDIKNPQRMIVGANNDNYFISNDGGYSWQQSRLFSSTLGVWGDPCVVIDTLGNFYFFHLSNPPGPAFIDQIVCQKSTDNGATWNNGKGIGFVQGKNQDKEWAVVDRSNNHLYVAWTQFDTYGSTNPADSSIICFSRSEDLGESWSSPIRLNRMAGDCMDSDNTVEGATPAIGPQGEIYVSWARPEGIRFNRSSDGGLTWLENDIGVNEMPGGWDFGIPGIYRANGFPVIGCDAGYSAYRGNIYINWSDQRNGVNDTDIWFSRSADGGNTWSEPMRVNDDPPGNQQFFNWMSVDQITGYIWIVFYDRRNHSDWQTDVYGAVSKDGGDSFTNFKISDAPFLPNPNIFFGDYNNITAHNNIVRPVWTRLHNDELSIYTAIIDTAMVAVPVTEHSLSQAAMNVHPNPFTQSVSISFKLIQPSMVNLTIYDLTGRRMLNQIPMQWMDAGKYVEKFDAARYLLKAGVYVAELSINGNIQTYKLIYLP